MVQEIREKYYFPSIATYVKNWVRDCEIFLQEKRINNTRITPELFQIPEWDLGPEDLMHIDQLPELPPRRGYEKIVTAIDVVSRYTFAYPVSNPTARYYDKTRLFTYTDYQRQRKHFRLPSYT